MRASKYVEMVDAYEPRISSFVIPKSQKNISPVCKLAGRVIYMDDGLFNGEIGILVWGNCVVEATPSMKELILKEASISETSKSSAWFMKTGGVFYFPEEVIYPKGEERIIAKGFIITSQKIYFVKYGDELESIPIEDCPRCFQSYLATLIKHAYFDIKPQCIRIKDMDPGFRKFLVNELHWTDEKSILEAIEVMALTPYEHALLFENLHWFENREDVCEKASKIIYGRLKGSKKLHQFMIHLGKISEFGAEPWGRMFKLMSYPELMNCLMDDTFKVCKDFIEEQLEKHLP